MKDDDDDYAYFALNNGCGLEETKVCLCGDTGARRRDQLRF